MYVPPDLGTAVGGGENEHVERHFRPPGPLSISPTDAEVRRSIRLRRAALKEMISFYRARVARYVREDRDLQDAERKLDDYYDQTCPR